MCSNCRLDTRRTHTGQQVDKQRTKYERDGVKVATKIQKRL